MSVIICFCSLIVEDKRAWNRLRPENEAHGRERMKTAFGLNGNRSEGGWREREMVRADSGCLGEDGRKQWVRRRTGSRGRVRDFSSSSSSSSVIIGDVIEGGVAEGGKEKRWS